MDAVGGEAETASQRWPQRVTQVERLWCECGAQEFSQVNGGERPHLPQKVDTGRGTMALPTGQHWCLIRSSRHQCANSRCATTKSVSCCLKIGHRGIQKEGGNRFDQAEQDNRLFEKVFRRSLSECCHRDRTGRMESGCVRVSILCTTIDGLLLLPSPCWLEELQSAGHVSVFLSPPLLWLMSYIATYDDKNMRNYTGMLKLISGFLNIDCSAHLHTPSSKHSLQLTTVN